MCFDHGVCHGDVYRTVRRFCTDIDDVACDPLQRHFIKSHLIPISILVPKPEQLSCLHTETPSKMLNQRPRHNEPIVLNTFGSNEKDRHIVRAYNTINLQIMGVEDARWQGVKKMSGSDCMDSYEVGKDQSNKFLILPTMPLSAGSIVSPLTSAY